MIVNKIYKSPIGLIYLCTDGLNLTGLNFSTSRFINGDIEINSIDNNAIELTEKWLDIYFRGDIPDFLPPIKQEGSSFQKEVWDILMEIPYGSTITYGDIANKLAKRRGIKKMSSQAVGNAVGRNMIGIIIPCHRVIGKDGSLVGYGGGLDKKEKLLQLERLHYFEH